MPEAIEKTESFEDLVEIHADALRTAARRYGGHAAEADDLAQEVWLRAFKYFDQYRRGTNPRAWLLTILKNTYFNRFRRTRLEREVLRSKERAFDPTAGDSSSELPEAIRKAVERLPEDHHRVVSLVDVSGLSYREAAAAIGIPIGTVMSRLSRARGLLRDMLCGAYPDHAAKSPASHRPTAA